MRGILPMRELLAEGRPVVPTGESEGQGRGCHRGGRARVHRRIGGAIRRWQMVWLFNRRFTSWMADRSLRSQLPVPYRWFGGYCRAWAVLTRWSWVPLGKQAFFIAVWLNRLFGGPREIFLRIHHAEIGLTLGDPRMLKVVHEALPGSDETAILAAVLSAGDSFIDVGANHGSYSVAACRIVGRTGFVVAAEAQPGLAALIEETLRRSAPCRWHVYAGAVADRRSSAPFFVLRRNSGESSFFRGPSTAGVHTATTVPVERLDDAIPWRDLPGRTVVKLDVEGAECMVLDGAKELVASLRPVLLLEVNPAAMSAANVSWQGLLARLLDLGYDRFSETGNPGDAMPLESLDPDRHRDIVVLPGVSADPRRAAGPMSPTP